MTDFLGVLAISGVLATASVASPAMAQTEGGARDATQVAGSQTESPAPPASAPIAPEDVKQAVAQIRASWRNYEKCDRMRLCNDYFESFGVGLTFNDGTLVPFSHLQRLTASQHDCIVKAHDALDHGDKALAVQWVMASQMQEPLDRNWLGDHPDAVIEALRQCCG